MLVINNIEDYHKLFNNAAFPHDGVFEKYRNESLNKLKYDPLIHNDCKEVYFSRLKS